MHTRDPSNCSWPNVKPIAITCPTCKDMEGKYKTRHPANKGHTYLEGCRFEGKSPFGAPNRTGQHPRPPREVTKDHPSADAGAYDAAQGIDADAAADNTGSTSSDDPRGSREPTTRTQKTSTGSGPTRLPDWTRFDLSSIFKRLKSDDPAVIQKELRLLHLRWWHASVKTMKEFLSQAGLDTVRLSMIKPLA